MLIQWRPSSQPQIQHSVPLTEDKLELTHRHPRMVLLKIQNQILCGQVPTKIHLLGEIAAFPGLITR